MKLLSALILSLGLSTAVWADDGPDAYLCIMEHAGGIAFDKTTKEWSSTKFNETTKYILRRPKDGDFLVRGSKWLIFKFGDTSFTSGCQKEVNEYGFLRCDRGLTEFLFSSKTLRIQSFYVGAYVGSKGTESEGSDTPSISIGTCSPL